MKKRDIWISVAIIAAAVLLLYSYSQGTGQIKIDAAGAVATLQLRSSWLGKSTISSGAEPAKVSARAHRPAQLSLSMQQGSNTWRLESRGPWGKMSTIRVKNNDTTVLKLGPPFLIKPKVRKSGSRISIDFTIIGQAGERYRNSRRGSAPKLKIVDETGNVLASGKFEYG
jgi:hypothetical protein